VRLQTVDSNGVYPLWATDRVFTVAHSFRRHLQKEITPFLLETPRPEPLAASRLPKLAELPAEVLRQWPAAALDRFERPDADLGAFPIDHGVASTGLRGGAVAASAALKRFVDERLPLYATTRNEPEQEVASGLSPYLHFGHISAHELFAAVMKRDAWTPARLTVKPHGKAQGWWQASPEVESFLEELLVWREIGYNFSAHRPRDYHRYESLPGWVLETLEKHSIDKRPWVYTLAEFEAAKTHDPLWNAAQRQLVREGRIHNYLRMLWGKKILEWSAHPREALATMVELNKFMEAAVQEYLTAVYAPKNDTKMRITQSWCNYTKPGQFHHKHAHPNSFISGVFYLQTTAQDKIYFYREGYQQIKMPTDNWNVWNSESWWFEATKGRLILFPSSLTHMVETVKGDDTRISMSFNTFPVGNVGDDAALTGLYL